MLDEIPIEKPWLRHQRVKPQRVKPRVTAGVWRGLRYSLLLDGAVALGIVAIVLAVRWM
jgi:hypothetical protein